MKNKLFAVLLAVGSMASASGSEIIFQDDFSSDTLATNYSIQGANYNATAETVTINRGYNNGANFLEVTDTLALDTGGSTQMTIAFDYAFGSGMYGSGFIVEYNDNNGTGWQVIDSINYTSTNANNDGLAVNPYTVTITEGNTYSFTDGATIRIKAATVNGGGGYNIDNLAISVDQTIKPSKGTVIMISSVGGWSMLFFSFIFWREIQRGRKCDAPASLNDSETSQ
jgi:hypothetical protein